MIFDPRERIIVICHGILLVSIRINYTNYNLNKLKETIQS